jgi:hypothetical protein
MGRPVAREIQELVKRADLELPRGREPHHREGDAQALRDCRLQGKHRQHAAQRDSRLRRPPGREDVWLTEAEFVSLPLFERMFDPSGFPRVEGFRSWLFRLFATYPVADPGTPEPAVSLRRVLSMLALQTTVAESLRVAFTMMGYAETGELEVTSLHEFLLMPAHWTPRPAAVPEPEPLLQVEEVVHAFRDIITPSGAQALTIADHNVDVVVENAIATGRIEAGMQAVLSHPNIAALPLEHRWTRPQFF